VLLPGAPVAGAGSSEQTEVAEQRAMLDQIIGQLDVAPEGLVQRMEQQRKKNEELEAANQGLLTHVRTLRKAQDQAQAEQKALKQQVAQLEQAVDKLKEQRAQQRTTIANLRQRLGEEDQQAAQSWARMAWHWRWYLAAAVLLAAALVLVVIWSRPAMAEQDSMPDEEPSADDPPNG
jgi:predicted RNase H-like nuclease (RuvC/YqgF family)